VRVLEWRVKIKKAGVGVDGGVEDGIDIGVGVNVGGGEIFCFWIEG
jgi:hypothetical protein